MKLHEMLFAPCLSARPLFSCHRSIARASARTSVAGPLLVCHWSARVVVAVLSLVCHSSICSCVGHSSVTRASVTRLSLVHLFVRLLVHRSSITHPSARASARVRFACRWSVTPLSHSSVTRLSVRSSLVCLLVQLLGSWSLPRGWSATRLSPIRRWSWPLVHLIVRRALLCPLLCPLLSCLLFCHQSVCSSVCSCLSRPSASRRWFVCSFVARPFVRVVVARLSVRIVVTGLLILLLVCRCPVPV